MARHGGVRELRDAGHHLNLFLERPSHMCILGSALDHHSGDIVRSRWCARLHASNVGRHLRLQLLDWGESVSHGVGTLVPRSLTMSCEVCSRHGRVRLGEHAVVDCRVSLCRPNCNSGTTFTWVDGGDPANLNTVPSAAGTGLFYTNQPDCSQYDEVYLMADAGWATVR